MTITCDTPIESLLNVDEVRAQVDDYVTIVTQVTDSLLTVMTREQLTGLSPNAFVIDGDSLIYDKSQMIQEKLSSIEEELSIWKKDIITKAEEKRKEELGKLILAVNFKLIELSGEITKLNVIKIINKDLSVQPQLEKLNKDCKYYQEKMEQLLGMKER